MYSCVPGTLFFNNTGERHELINSNRLCISKSSLLSNNDAGVGRGKGLIIGDDTIFPATTRRCFTERTSRPTFCPSRTSCKSICEQAIESSSETTFSGDKRSDSASSKTAVTVSTVQSTRQTRIADKEEVVPDSLTSPRPKPTLRSPFGFLACVSTFLIAFDCNRASHGTS